MRVERTTLPLDGARVAAVTAALHHPDTTTGPGVLLAPGAGGDLDGEGLVALAELFAELGHPTVRVNLPHQEGGARGAPRAERSVDAYRQLVDGAQAALAAPRPWIVGGKSYGGRVASMAVAGGMPATGLVFYGYPLHPPGKPSGLRVDHWPDIDVPCLFLQGSRDPFCDLELLDARLSRLPGEVTVRVVEGGDHSLRVTAAASPEGTPSRPSRTLAGLRPTIAAWVSQLG